MTPGRDRAARLGGIQADLKGSDVRRFSLAAAAATLAAQFGLFAAPAWTLRYNLAPTEEVLVVVVGPATATRQARRHRWGLIPSRTKNPAIGNQLINSQANTASGTFSGGFGPAVDCEFRTSDIG